MQLRRDQPQHFGLDILDGAFGKNLGALLGPDHMLQDQARVVLRRQLRAKAGHHGTGLLQAYCAQDGAGGKVAIRAVDHLGTDDANRNLGGAQDGLGYRAHQ